MLSVCYMGKISPWPRPWPRPGFSLRGMVQLLSRQGGPGSYADFAIAAMAATAEIAPVIILMSLQGWALRSKRQVVETFYETINCEIRAFSGRNLFAMVNESSKLKGRRAKSMESNCVALSFEP